MIAHEPGTRPPLDEACLSDLALDRLVAGEPIVDRHRLHLDGCDRCRARRALFARDAEEEADRVERLLAAARAEVAVPSRPSRPGWRAWLSPRRLSLAGAAALALVLVLLSLPQLDTPPDGLRAKGVAMRFFVQQGDAISPGVSGAAYREGDALRFAVSNDRPAWFLLVGIEESGAITACHPFGGDRSVRLPAGADAPLPGSLVLDDSDQAQAFVGLFTAEPLELSTVRAAVDRARGDDLEQTLEALDLPGQRRWVIVRRELP